MFSEELRKMLFQVISSWQVLTVTGVLIFYVFIVNNVARIYHRRPRRMKAPKKVKPIPAEAPVPQAPASESDKLDLEDEIEEK